MDEPQIWAAIEAVGPSREPTSFDPLMVDNVLWAERSATQYDRRKSFIASYAWAVPTLKAVQRICEFVGGRKVLEVGAGNGFWALLLSQAGARVVATDGSPNLQATWYLVEVVEAEAAVRQHDECRALLLCWPPFKDACAFRALHGFGGDRLIFVGDVRFTAEAQFHSLAQDSWELREVIELPSWPGTIDGVRLYVRKREISSSMGTTQDHPAKETTGTYLTNNCGEVHIDGRLGISSPPRADSMLCESKKERRVGVRRVEV